MNNLQFQIIKRNITIRSIAKELGLSNYQMGQKIASFDKLRYNEILFFLKKFDMKFEELFQEKI